MSEKRRVLMHKDDWVQKCALLEMEVSQLKCAIKKLSEENCELKSRVNSEKQSKISCFNGILKLRRCFDAYRDQR